MDEKSAGQDEQKEDGSEYTGGTEYSAELLLIVLENLKVEIKIVE
ncbi:hypothetical protein BER37_003933 [Clostridioides difficile]|nr:hypothetical protein [Clostridioides difficile]OMK77771.1 hypothetical protein BER37_003933 [Clostridioides difficile]